MPTQKLTAKQAIQKVLADAGKPMSVKEIIEAAVPLTALTGKTPGQTIYSVLYAENKKQHGAFKRVGRGRFKLAAPSNHPRPNGQA
jgi:hypothetical protein